MIRKTGPVIGAPNQPSGYNQRLRAERALGGYPEQLERARESAKGWQAGQIAILGLISVVGTVKSQQNIESLTASARWVATIAMVLALVAAVSAVVLLGIAARPLPRQQERTEAPDPVSSLRALRRTAGQIRVSLWATIAAVCLLAIAVVTTWIPATIEEPGDLVRVITTSNTLCGKLADSNGSTVVVQISGQRITTASRDVVAITPVITC